MLRDNTTIKQERTISNVESLVECIIGLVGIIDELDRKLSKAICDRDFYIEVCEELRDKKQKEEM